MNTELAKDTANGIALAAYPYPGGFNYYVIPWREISTRAKLENWIARLKDKRWFDDAMAKALIETAATHYHWDVNQLWWML